jgi:hypothetical protein
MQQTKSIPQMHIGPKSTHIDAIDEDEGSRRMSIDLSIDRPIQSGVKSCSRPVGS